MNRIRVLVVDDSLLFQRVLTKELEKDSEITVVGCAGDAYEARDLIIQFRPDVITLDLNMPRMYGTDFLKKLMAQYPIPIVVVSSETGVEKSVLDAGATAFALKPEDGSKETFEKFVHELSEIVKMASSIRFQKPSRKMTAQFNEKNVIAIGASTGGVDAVSKVISQLPEGMPPILIAQHIPPKFSRMFAERLNAESKLNVREAKDGEIISKGDVLIAPGDKHLQIKRIGGKLVAKVTQTEKVNGHRPSVDVLFDSFAQVINEDAIGVILTGMGKDGAKGLLRMLESGAYTIGQDEETSVVYGMPMEAKNIGAVKKQLPLEQIPGAIINCVKN